MRECLLASLTLKFWISFKYARKSSSALGEIRSSLALPDGAFYSPSMKDFERTRSETLVLCVNATSVEIVLVSLN